MITRFPCRPYYVAMPTTRQRPSHRCWSASVCSTGAGEGYVTAALQRRTNLWACAVDIGLSACRAHISFTMAPGCAFHDSTFDTTLISLALHHCTDPEAVLDEALRHHYTTDHPGVGLPESVRALRLERLDDWVSRYRHGGHMHPALAFKEVDEWQRIFAARSLVTVDRRWPGSRWERLVHQPALFVLEKPSSPRLRFTVLPEMRPQPGRTLDRRGSPLDSIHIVANGKGQREDLMIDTTADKSQSAVAIMAKAPQTGQVKTRLCPPLSHREAAQLYQCFLRDKITQVNTLPRAAPVVSYSPNESSLCSKT